MPFKFTDLALLRGLALRACLWFIPVFVFWWLLLTPVILPFLHQGADILLSQSFAKVHAHVEVQENNRWFISTSILMPQQPGDSNKRYLTHIEVKHNPMIFSFGLPILWMLLLAIPHQRGRNLLLGTALLSVLAVLLAWLMLTQLLVEVLADGQAHYVFISSTLSHRLEPFSPWSASLLQHVYSVLLYMNVLFLPGFLAYYLNQDWWTEKLPNTEI